MNLCKVCGKDDNNRPTIFKGEDWCSEAHRKQLASEKSKGSVVK